MNHGRMRAPINGDSERRLGHAVELRHGVGVFCRSRIARAQKCRRLFSVAGSFHFYLRDEIYRFVAKKSYGPL